jgi:hypothetical protein
MPFCRKCGRRLPEYSENCTQCGTSTTSPLIKIKKASASQLFRATASKKIAKAMIPKVSPIQIKVITDKPNKTATTDKAAATTKAATSITATSPFKVATPPKDVAPTKPVLSAKHIVKPKKATQTKPTAPFTISFARPVAGPSMVQRKPVGSHRPITQPVQHRSVVSSAPVLQRKPVAQVAPITATPVAPIISSKPVYAPLNPTVTLAKPVAPSKTIPPAPVYPPHEIIKSKTSLKEDILTHPEDYEMQSFDFNLKCSNGHFWREGKMLPVSKGKAYCLKCGEILSKPKAKKRRRYHRY